MIHGSLERIWFRIGEFYYDSILWILLLWADAYCSVEFIFWNICPYFCPNYVVVVHISVLKGHFQWYFGLRDNEEVLKFELLTCPKCLRIEIANTLISRLLKHLILCTYLRRAGAAFRVPQVQIYVSWVVIQIFSHSLFFTVIHVHVFVFQMALIFRGLASCF